MVITANAAIATIATIATLAPTVDGAMTKPMRRLMLGAVMALFLTLPYGKFAHGVFRCAALLKWSIERRQASRLRLGSD